jgi:reductive dehalogenase
MMFYLLFSLICIYAIFTLWFAVSAYWEKEPTAGTRGVILVFGMVVFLFFYAQVQANGLLDSTLMKTLQGIVAALMVLFTISMFVPLGRRREALKGTDGMRQGEPERFNQKDTAFNIAHVGGYGPEVGKQRWALQSRDPFGGIYWTLVMGLRPHADGKVNPKKQEGFTAEEITKEIKRTARYCGADLVGITKVKQDFCYSETFSYEESKLGTGPAVTSPVDVKHKYAIVFGREMNFHRIQNTLSSKNDESLGEIGKTYYELAQIACAVAAYIRQMGYSAKAHHVRNEQILQVPHAVDAGLGEQGRHNYLITGKYGPRVRLATVTTSLELIEDKPVDIGVQDFCESCRLCEINCPSQALAAEKAMVRGYRKWPQDYTKCFGFWVTGGNTFGCTLCLKVCPWNKPRTFVHRVSMYGATRSVVARRVLYWISLIFYGKLHRWKRLPLPDEIEMPPETQNWGKSSSN